MIYFLRYYQQNSFIVGGILESLAEPEKLTLYIMFIFIALLLLAMIVAAFYSHRANKQYTSWKEAKLNRISMRKAALIARENFDGYMVLSVMEENKSLLHDVLKGFEEYSLLKGYKVKLSINVEEKDKILVKISEFGSGGELSENKVKMDLEEYITKIRNGDLFDDIPRFIDPIHHERLILALKNRIYFLQQNFEVERNIRSMYEKIINSIDSNIYSERSITTINITGGETKMDNRKYVANRSSNVTQGDLQESSVVQGSTVKINKSFKEKALQIEGLKNLFELLQEGNSEDTGLAAKSIEKIIEELEDEETPNLGLIEKWLDKAGKIIKLMEKSSAIFSKAKEVYDSFGISL